MMSVGWWRKADRVHATSYGMGCRSFFVPGTRCQAPRGFGARHLYPHGCALRPQMVKPYAPVPGTSDTLCLALGCGVGGS